MSKLITAQVWLLVISGSVYKGGLVGNVSPVMFNSRTDCEVASAALVGNVYGRCVRVVVVLGEK